MSVEEDIRDSISVKEKLILQAGLIEDIAELVTATFRDKKKVLLAGNGGSAADAQHTAGELVGRFRMERSALAALSLSTDTSVLTALANDYGGESVFSRQVEALGVEGDLLWVFSTSGSSPNILKAVEAARSLGLNVVGFTGGKGVKLAGLCDLCLMVDSSDTPRIQEAHITAAHIICSIVEKKLFGDE